jgi:hypothetical protein
MRLGDDPAGVAHQRQFSGTLERDHDRFIK